MKPIVRVKIREERFATPQNKALMARARFKRAVIKILTKLQAYHLYEKIKRNKLCVIPLSKFIRNYTPYIKGFNSARDNTFVEDSDEMEDQDDDSSKQSGDSSKGSDERESDNGLQNNMMLFGEEQNSARGIASADKSPKLARQQSIKSVKSVRSAKDIPSIKVTG